MVINNIKEDFCTFTGKKVQIFLKDMDERYETIKSRIEETINMKVLSEINKIERFSDEYAALESLILNHA